MTLRLVDTWRDASMPERVAYYLRDGASPMLICVEVWSGRVKSVSSHGGPDGSRRSVDHLKSLGLVRQ